jgi:asparagine N-glycosylation enzyme membrane subunit Stt3
VIAALAVLLIPITFLLGRTLIGRGPALIAAVLVAIDILHLTLSQQARPLSPFATVGTLALLVILRVQSRGRVLDCLLAGVGVGPAVGILHFGAFLIPPLVLGAFVGLVIAVRRYFTYGRRGGRTWRPYANVLFVLAFAAPFALVVGGIIWTQTRFLVPFVPLLALLGAFGLWHSARMLTIRIASHRVRRLAFLMCIVVVIAGPVAVAIRCAAVRCRADTLTIAASWITERASPNHDSICVGRRAFLPIFSEQTELRNSERYGKTYRASWSTYLDLFRSRVPQERTYRITELTTTDLSEQDRDNGGSPIDDATTNVGAAEARLAASTDRFLVLARRRFIVDPYETASRRAGWRLVASILSSDPSHKYDFDDGYQDRDLFLRAALSTAWGPAIEIFENPNAR